MRNPLPKETRAALGREAGAEATCEIIKQLEAAGGTNEAIFREICGIALADITNFVDVDDLGIVRVKPIPEWPEGKGGLVRKIREKRVIRTEKGTKDKPDGETVLDSTFEFEMHDKLDALGKIVAIKGIQKPAKIDVSYENKAIETYSDAELEDILGRILAEEGRHRKASNRRTGKKKAVAGKPARLRKGDRGPGKAGVRKSR